MNKDFINYEQALALRELGFDEPCVGYWRDENLSNPLTLGQYTTKEDMEYEISGQDEYHNFKNIIALAPLYQQAFRWFREKYDKYGVVNIDLSNNLEDKIFVYMVENKLGYTIERSEEYNTYEKAELACLIKLIEIVKN
jgi:hypothetical protein